MNVLFLIEAGGRYGLGHLMRSNVLIDAIRARGVEPRPLLRAGEKSLPEWALPAGERMILGDDDRVAVESAENAVRVLNPQWSVVDGYDFVSAKVVDRLHALGVRVLVFDDLGLEGGGADIVVNQNRAHNGEGRENALLGPKYALVDKSYAARVVRAVPASISRVLITFGGSDLHAITARVVSAFSTVPGELDIDVVIGPYHSMRQFEAPGRHRLTLHETPHGLASLFGAADLVISAAGSTCWQACCVGVPLIAIQTVDNQRDVRASLSGAGCALTYAREDFSKRLGAGELPSILEKLSQPARAAVVKAQRALVDGKGAARIVAAMGL